MSSSDHQNFSVPVFRLPFRPFFLGAGLFSVFAIILWGGYWLGFDQIKPAAGIFWWHGHEMVFGFAGAVLVGFLLTAAKNWTGLPGLAGWPLVFLFLTWLIPRICYLFGSTLMVTVAMVFETAFWLLACYFYSRMIIKKRLWSNLGFTFILIGLAVLNLLSIRSSTNGGDILRYLHAGVIFFVLVLTIIGGRIIPFFTASATGSVKVEPNRFIEIPVILLSVSLLIWALVSGIVVPSMSLGIVLLVLCLLHLIRFSRWPIRYSFSNPMLWSLYLGYCCMVLGILLLASYHLGIFPNLSSAIHMLTIGAIGLMILTMMSRVSLGHTGRGVKSTPMLTIAFILILLTALIRAFLWFSGLEISLAYGYAAAAGIWVIAYLIWLMRFIPILLKARQDGKPG